MKLKKNSDKEIDFRYHGGYPAFNMEYNLIALNHCIEGLCESNINIFDLDRLEFIDPIQLNFENRSVALKYSWDGILLNVDILNTSTSYIFIFKFLF